MNANPRWAVEGRDWPNREFSRFVDVGRLRWHVQVMGSGPAVLLLHGTGAATHSWRDFAPILAKHFTVIGLDLPGHGFTAGRPRGGLALPAVSQAIGDLLSTLGSDPRMIIGHSAGAAIAVRMCLDEIARPRAVVGLGAALLPFPGLAARLFPALARIMFVNPFAPQIFARMARVPGETAHFLQRSTGSDVDRASVHSYETLLSKPGHVAGALSMMASWDLEPLRHDLRHLRQPMLLIHGDRDSAIPVARAREVEEIIPDGQLKVLAGLGHLAHEERPHEVYEIIRTFIEDRGWDRDFSV